MGFVQDIMNFDSFAAEKLDVAVGVVTYLTPAVYAPVPIGGLEQRRAQLAFITVESNPIRFWVHGEDPTSTEGHLVLENGTIDLLPVEIEKFAAIAIGGTAVLMITYKK